MNCLNSLQSSRADTQKTGASWSDLQSRCFTMCERALASEFRRLTKEYRSAEGMKQLGTFFRNLILDETHDCTEKSDLLFALRDKTPFCAILLYLLENEPAGFHGALILLPRSLKEEVIKWIIFSRPRDWTSLFAKFFSMSLPAVGEEYTAYGTYLFEAFSEEALQEIVQEILRRQDLETFAHLLVCNSVFDLGAEGILIDQVFTLAGKIAGPIKGNYRGINNFQSFAQPLLNGEEFSSLLGRFNDLNPEGQALILCTVSSEVCLKLLRQATKNTSLMEQWVDHIEDLRKQGGKRPIYQQFVLSLKGDELFKLLSSLTASTSPAVVYFVLELITHSIERRMKIQPEELQYLLMVGLPLSALTTQTALQEFMESSPVTVEWLLFQTRLHYGRMGVCTLGQLVEHFQVCEEHFVPIEEDIASIPPFLIATAFFNDALRPQLLKHARFFSPEQLAALAHGLTKETDIACLRMLKISIPPENLEVVINSLPQEQLHEFLTDEAKELSLKLRNVRKTIRDLKCKLGEQVLAREEAVLIYSTLNSLLTELTLLLGPNMAKLHAFLHIKAKELKDNPLCSEGSCLIEGLKNSVKEIESLKKMVEAQRPKEEEEEEPSLDNVLELFFPLFLGLNTARLRNVGVYTPKDLEAMGVAVENIDPSKKIYEAFLGLFSQKFHDRITAIAISGEESGMGELERDLKNSYAKEFLPLAKSFLQAYAAYPALPSGLQEKALKLLENLSSSKRKHTDLNQGRFNEFLPEILRHIVFQFPEMRFKRYLEQSNLAENWGFLNTKSLSRLSQLDDLCFADEFMQMQLIVDKFGGN